MAKRRTANQVILDQMESDRIVEMMRILRGHHAALQVYLVDIREDLAAKMDVTKTLSAMLAQVDRYRLASLIAEKRITRKLNQL